MPSSDSQITWNRGGFEEMLEAETVKIAQWLKSLCCSSTESRFDF